MGVVLFVVAVTVLVAVWMAAVAVRAEHRRVISAARGNADASLGPYELAYLSGGPLRAVNTAIGVLARVGAVRVSRGGQIGLVTGALSRSEAIEQAVLDTLRGRGGSCPATELRRTVAEGVAMDGLRYRLLGMGLLVPESALGEAHRLLRRLLTLTVVAVVFEVFTVLFLAVSDTADFFFVASAPLGTLASLVGLFAYLKMRRTLRGIVTEAGSRALASARRVHVRGVRSATPDLALAVAFPVALYGLGELGDPVLEEELNRANSHAATSGSGCASGSCGGGSAGSSDSSSYGGGGDFGSGGWGGGGDSGGGSSCGSGSSCGGGGCGGGCGG
ncbi:TIGR04222 domain-containing membrane protein [Streptosporangium carneum]|uniref:TIGR04222 domain-containing membrane protein n=1 Tax=Streptosporangium carneum TaxID=47481 RepID=A0A9W6I4R3_9ACTN|nr:TIGR04222 domain-containing membrane protein [Streptosporangium carneum]GLK11662.1 hypothetical protein GCM10017600_50690 [Streptosporangium carneum]